MPEHDNCKRAPARTPDPLTPSEIESLRRDARKMDEAAKAYFTIKPEEEANPQSEEESERDTNGTLRGS